MNEKQIEKLKEIIESNEYIIVINDNQFKIIKEGSIEYDLDLRKNVLHSHNSQGYDYTVLENLNPKKITFYKKVDLKL